MSWEYVFRYGFNLVKGKTVEIEDAKNLAAVCGYKFFAFNGRVYFINGDGVAEYTGITTENLF